MWDLRLWFWDDFFFFSVHHSRLQPIFVRLRLLVVLVYLSTNFFFIVSFLLMALKRETIASRAQDKRPTELSQLAQTKARQKTRFDTTLFSSVENY